MPCHGEYRQCHGVGFAQFVEPDLSRPETVERFYGEVRDVPTEARLTIEQAADQADVRLRSRGVQETDGAKFSFPIVTFRLSGVLIKRCCRLFGSPGCRLDGWARSRGSGERWRSR